MPTVIDLKEQRAQIWERMKGINDAAEAENRGLTAEEQSNWDQADGNISKLDERITRQERLERAPAQRESGDALKLTRAVMANPAELRATKEYADAHGRWLRGMDSADDRMLMMPALRAMNTISGSAGGFAVPESMEAGIEKALLAYGGMREVATVRSTADGGDWVFLVGNDTSNTGEILAEGAAVSEQETTIGARVLKAYTYSSKMIRVSLQLMQDASFDVNSYVAGLLAERIYRITNTHFTTGTGANMPRGIMSDAASGVAGATGQTTTVTWDDLLALEHSVGSIYRRGARFMFADTTLLALRKLKNGEGNYLWQPGMANAPSTIDGYPYTINDDMAAMAASAKSILFGQLSRYIIRDVKGWTLMRFSEKYGEYLQVAFTGFSRHDGMLIDAGTNPVKYYSNSAT
jgi:HK97 family phage major capsid protein